MKAVRVHTFGGPEVLTYEDAPDPAAPGAGLAAVDIQIIGINYSDTNYRRGLGAARTMSLPLIPGHEAAGVVTAIGAGVTEVKVGDRVVFAGQHRFGTYKEKTIVAANMLVPVPAGFDLKLAVAVLNQGQTAHYLLHDARKTERGDRVLVHAAAGGVGSNLVQMAKMLGAYVYATVSSDEKAEFVRKLGADKIIMYTRSDFVEEIKKDTVGKGINAVFDAVGGDVRWNSLRCLLEGPSVDLWPERGRGPAAGVASARLEFGLCQQPWRCRLCSSGRNLWPNPGRPCSRNLRLGRERQAQGPRPQGVPARRRRHRAARHR